MAEIVRVLKWRLDLEAKGFADGLEKASDQAERFKDSVDQIGDRGAPALKKASDAADEATASLEGLGLETKQVEMYLGRLEKGAGSPLVLQRNAELAEAALNVLAFKASAAGNALDDAFSGRVLGAIDAAKQQAEGMNAELEKMGGQTPTKLDKVITALEKTGEKAGLASKGMQGAAVATGKLDAQTSQLAKSVLSASGLLGPYGGMIEKLQGSGDGAATSIAGLAFKTAAFAGAAKLGWEAGEKLDEKLKEIGIDLSDPITALEKLEEVLRRTSEAASDSDTSITEVATGVRNLEVGLASIPQPVKDFVLGLIDVAKGARAAGAEIGTLTADIDLESAALTEHTKRLAGDIVARAAQRRATTEADAAVKGALSGWKSAADQQKELDASIAAVAQKLGDLQKTGADWRAEVEANEEPLQRWVESLKDGNVTLSSLPKPLQDAIAYLDSLAKKHDEGADAARRHADAEEAAAKRARENAMNANRAGTPVTQPADPNAREGVKVIQETTEGLKRQTEATVEAVEAAWNMREAAEAEGQAMRDATTATEQAERVKRGFGTSLDYVAQKVSESNGTLVVGESILLNLAAAEDRVVQALYRRLEATKLLTAAQMESLGVAEGWLAYIANIEDSMARGITSTTVGVGLLADLQRQLQTMFAGATGDAKKTIDDVNDAIRALLATITGGGIPTLDVSPLGQLEREIARKKGGR